MNKEKYLSKADKEIAGILELPLDDVVEIPPKLLNSDGYIDPAKLKQEFLTMSYPVMIQMVNSATGREQLQGDRNAQGAVWQLFHEIMKTTADVTPTISLEGKTTQEKIETVFVAVSNGQLSQDAAKNYMELITKGFDTLELQDMMDKVDSFGGG